MDDETVKTIRTVTEGDKTFYLVLYDSVLTNLENTPVDLNADSGAAGNGWRESAGTSNTG